MEQDREEREIKRNREGKGICGHECALCVWVRVEASRTASSLPVQVDSMLTLLCLLKPLKASRKLNSIVGLSIFFQHCKPFAFNPLQCEGTTLVVLVYVVCCWSKCHYREHDCGIDICSRILSPGKNPLIFFGKMLSVPVLGGPGQTKVSGVRLVIRNIPISIFHPLGLSSGIGRWSQAQDFCGNCWERFFLLNLQLWGYKSCWNPSYQHEEKACLWMKERRWRQAEAKIPGPWWCSLSTWV